MTEVGLAAGVLTAILAPHRLGLHRAEPRIAAAVWLTVLLLRAVVALALATFVLLYLPQTELFSAIAQWCSHAVVPILTTHLGVSGHRLADAAVLLPSLALAGSVLWLLFGVLRTGLALRAHVRRASRRDGPLGSTVVEDPEVIVAVTSVGKAQLLVSEAALQVLDDEELAASLSHELGHLNRRHRPLLLAGSLLAAVGRLLPGTAAARVALAFSLERDADAYAVRHTGNPLALASAICKAAGARARLHGILSLTGGGHLGVRLDQLLEHRGRRDDFGVWSTRLLAAVMLAATVAITGLFVDWALVGAANASTSQPHGAPCPH